jgi:transcriptional regulator with XRE-family HTH domain
MNEKKSFGYYIRKKRLEAGLTQRELAEQLFVTESTVSKWERALSYPDVSMVMPICAALHITEHEFFTACDDDQTHTQERQAAVWRGVVTGTRRFFAAGYAIAIAVCFICNLAVFHTLNWFWIVLTACALAFCFTNLPFLLQRSRLTVSLGAASGCLVLLLLACWVNVGGWWIIGGLAGGVPGPALGMVGRVAFLRKARAAAVHGGADGVGVFAAGRHLGVRRWELAVHPGLSPGAGGGGIFVGRVRRALLAAHGAVAEGGRHRPAGQPGYAGVQQPVRSAH